MALIQVHTNAPSVRRDLDRLGEAIERKIITRSLNRTIVGVRTDASRAARAELNLKAKRVNRDLSVRRARPGAHAASVQIAAKTTPLFEFGARKTTRGISVKVKRKGKRTTLRHAFIAKMKSGHVGVFERIPGKNRLGTSGTPRAGYLGSFPIKELQSTALVQFFDDESVLQPIATRARDRFERELEQQVRYEVSKLGGRA